MARLSTRIEQIERVFEGEAQAAKWRVTQVVLMMSRAEKELMMDGLQAEFRGEPEPSGFAEAMARFERFGGMEAMRRLEPLETDADRAGAEERRRRMAAGEDWRKIRL